jgi:hypothetical protein
VSVVATRRLGRRREYQKAGLARYRLSRPKSRCNPQVLTRPIKYLRSTYAACYMSKHNLSGGGLFAGVMHWGELAGNVSCALGSDCEDETLCAPASFYKFAKRDFKDGKSARFQLVASLRGTLVHYDVLLYHNGVTCK